MSNKQSETIRKAASNNRIMKKMKHFFKKIKQLEKNPQN